MVNQVTSIGKAPQSSIPSSHRLPTYSASEALRKLRDSGARTIPTGLPDLDAKLTGHASTSYGRGGLVRGQLTEIFGPPGSGKTAVGLQASASAIRDGGHVVWIDCASTVARPRFEAACEGTTEPISKLHHFATPTLHHLITFVQHQRADFPPPSTSLLVLDDVSVLFRPPRSRSGLKHATPRQAPSAIQLVLLNALNRLASCSNMAVLITSHVSTRVRPGGALLVAAHGAKDWDDGLSSRIALFRDFPPPRPPERSNGMGTTKAALLSRLRYAGIMKAHGVDGIENDIIKEVIPFSLSEDGHIVPIDLSIEADSDPPMITSPVKNKKRKLEEVPDSDDDWEGELDTVEGYDWDDEVVIVGSRSVADDAEGVKKAKIDKEPDAEADQNQ